MTDRSTPPPVHDVPLMPIPDAERRTLPNGIGLVILNNPDLDPLTRITFSWEGGSLDTPMPHAADIASQLVRTGSQKLNTDAMADLLDFNGAWLTSELLSHNNTLTLFSLNRTLDTLLAAVVDMINEPSFPEDEFITLREKLAASRAMALERVTTHAQMLDNRLAFGDGHPMTLNFTPDEIRQVTLDMAKEASRRLKGRQAPVVFVVGRVTPEVVAMVENHLSRLDCDSNVRGAVNIVPACPSPASRLHAEIPGALQSALRVTIPTIPRSHPDYEAVRLMVTELGGYFGSRLMTNIREEKGLTYGISAAVYGHREGAFITITSQCDNRYTDDVITEIEHEMEKLATDPMTDDELRMLRQTATGTLLGMLDTPFSIMDYYIVQRHIVTPPDYFARQQKAIAALTPESICDTARKYLIGHPRLISTAGEAR